MKKLQKTELSFIVQAKEGKQYKNLVKFPCGVRQHGYSRAYKHAQDILHILEESGLTCRLITKYVKLSNQDFQLSLI